MTALSAFGIIGVGAVELIMYPYWCLEKGYARYAGRDDGSAGWVERAKGWMRVMRVDAWLSMVVYTLATVGFYLLGAAVLHRVKLDPQSGDMIRTLSQMYVPVFGSWARGVFLVGAFSVLYSTLFVAAAGNARMVADGLCLMGILHHDEATRMRWSKIISVIWPLLAGVLYVVVRDAPRMVLLCGTAQMLMLPLLGIAALWFRYQRSIESLEPGRLWDLLLWISVLGFFLTAGSYLYSKLPSFFAS
jgi:Mn2+/Fe2+ NRAMP family transporter